MNSTPSDRKGFLPRLGLRPHPANPKALNTMTGVCSSDVTHCHASTKHLARENSRKEKNFCRAKVEISVEKISSWKRSRFCRPAFLLKADARRSFRSQTPPRRLKFVNLQLVFSSNTSHCWHYGCLLPTFPTSRSEIFSPITGSDRLLAYKGIAEASRTPIICSMSRLGFSSSRSMKSA